MPIYTYRCQDCGAEVEQRQSFSDDPLTVCQSCGGTLRRTLHSVAIIFKGTGFYNTDNRPNTTTSNGDVSGDKAEKKDDGKGAPAEGGATKASEASSSSSSSESAAPAAAPAAPAAKESASNSSSSTSSSKSGGSSD